MKIVWIGILFHLLMFLWLREDGIPSFKRSEPCTHRAFDQSARLLFVIVPGQLMDRKHEAFFSDTSFSIIHGWVTLHDCPSVFSYFSGLLSPPLLPSDVDSIFDHVDYTIYSGRRDYIVEKPFIKAQMPAYYYRRPEAEQAELDAVEGYIFRQSTMNGSDLLGSKFLSANSTLFVVHLGGLNETEASANLLYQLFFDIRMLVRSIDLAYGNVGTNALLIGEESGPFALWGPDVSVPIGEDQPEIRMAASDVAPLVAGLLRVAVPHDSMGLISCHLINDRKHLGAHYCNAIQLNTLKDEMVRGPVMEDLRFNTTMSMIWAKASVDLKLQHPFMDPIPNLNADLSRTLSEVKNRQKQILFWMGVCVCVAWTYLLIIELTSMHASPSQCSSLMKALIHIVFGLLTSAAIIETEILQLPMWWSLYLSSTIVLMWIATSRSGVLVSCFTSGWWKRLQSLASYGSGCLLLSEYWWRSSQNELLSLTIGLCIFTQFPVLPRFFLSPRLPKCIWWFVCLSLLGCLFWPKMEPINREVGRQSNFFTFGCTIWLCLSGMSTMSLKGIRDILLGVLITFLTGVALLVQSVARAPEFVGELKYLSLPMMLIPFLPLLGRQKRTSRLKHVIFSSGTIIILTSVSTEPLTFLLAMAAVILWTLMEQFNIPDKFGMEEFRRAIFLAVAISTTVSVTETHPVAYVHFGVPKLLPILILYRRTVISTCVMTIYFTAMPSNKQSYASYIIVFISDALATLRSVIFESKIDGTTTFHIGSIALALAFYFGQLLAIPINFEKADFGPPQPEAP